MQTQGNFFLGSYSMQDKSRRHPFTTTFSKLSTAASFSIKHIFIKTRTTYCQRQYSGPAFGLPTVNGSSYIYHSTYLLSTAVVQLIKASSKTLLECQNVKCPKLLYGSTLHAMRRMATASVTIVLRVTN